MPIVSVHIPQIGEGLQEARLVAVLKQPGDRVRRDEPIYQMETDKAVMDVESPFEGTLVSWSAPPDTLLPIGAEIAKMEVASEVPAAAPHGQSPAATAPTSTGESVVALRIPMIGEGLQEARLVAVLKQPGDTVRRDEPIYQMETDKAVMDVESPYAGVLEAWVAEPDTVLPIGAEVGRMRVQGAVEESVSSHGPAPSASTGASPAAARAASGERRTDIPPRTRAYAKEKGITEDQLQTIPAAGAKLMPADIDKFLSGGAAAASGAPAAPTLASNDTYAEAAVPQKQRLLASRLVRGSQLVVPGTITVACQWGAMEAERARVKATGETFQPSAFTMFAFAVARALADFPAFRSTLIGDDKLRTYHHANLGIAVALPGDELVLAVVDRSDTLAWRMFADRCREQIDLARGGKDQANESVTLSLTNMQAFGLRDAVPVVVPPSVGTLFLGEPYTGLAQDSATPQMCRYVNLALTFDHRVINGVGAAEFINAVRRNVEAITSLVSGA
ncbi:MAG: 2-oxo acid dehydrogenase subunit E2 [Chthonomonas sp.]|nr:2-oxo acid dehydrogenase subunit E2 [Chthonomonas sp.]